MSEKTNKLSICLVKPDFTEFSDIVKEDLKSHEIENVGTFYSSDSHANSPDWVRDFFGDEIPDGMRLFTASARGVLLVPVQVEEGRTRTFAITFGHGRLMLNEGVIEERFGLKVVLNSVIRDSLRSIDKTTLGSTPKQSREQMSRESDTSSFGIDVDQDLLNAVTGRSNVAALGKTIAGRDTLAVSVKVNISEIKKFLPICFKQYESETYKADFDWIDQIQDVRDPKLLGTLNDWLSNRLEAEQLDKIWMAPPSVLDWVDLKGFRYIKQKQGNLVPDLDVRTFLDALGGVSPTLDMLKKKSIFAVSARTNEIFDHWPAYRCLYAEAEIDSDMFVLNSGTWYKIASGFTADVLGAFNEFPRSTIELPNYNHDNEGAYNAALPQSIAGSYSMDAKNISYGGGHSRIEFCDFVTPDNQLIHVKRYSGSAQLSHLFNQGVVSGELFASDEKFREKLNEKLPDGHKLTDVSARPDTRNYEIIFAIISKSNSPLDIPFFSKVSLRNARRTLRGYDYNVSLKKIQNVGAQ